MKRRAQFGQILSSATSLTVNRYFRLMALSMAEIVFNLPITIYGLYINITFEPIYPWQGWDNIHFEYFIIDTFPSLIWRMDKTAVVTLELARWSLVFCGLLFFAFFGFAEEARKNYRFAYWAVAKRFGVAQPSPSLISSKTLTRCAFLCQISIVQEFKWSRSSKNSGYVTPAKVDSPLPLYVPRPLQLTSTARDSVDRTNSFKSEYTATLNDQSPSYPEYKIGLPPSPPTSSSHSTCNFPEINLPKRPHSSIY